MQERAIHIPSVNRQKIGNSKAEDFIIKFDPVLTRQNNTRLLRLTAGITFQISIKIIQ